MLSFLKPWSEGSLHLRRFKEGLNAYGADEIYAYGTSALRSTGNSKDFIDKVKEETGISVRIIPGVEEAEFIYYGVREAVDLGEKPQLLMDIGGGSVEFIVGTRDKLIWRQSYELGAQRTHGWLPQA